MPLNRLIYKGLKERTEYVFMSNTIFYYKFQNNILISKDKYPFEEVSEDYASNFKEKLFSLNSLTVGKSRRSYCVTSFGNLFIEKEKLELLKENKNDSLNMPDWINECINNRDITFVNTNYPNWQEVLKNKFPIIRDIKSNRKWSITVVGLGDVGGTLITGLRILGEDCISHINIYDKDKNKVKRWEYECNQILSPSAEINYPVIVPINEEDLFSCDMFVFCVSVGVPPIGKESSDVRAIQFDGNAKIVNYYAKLAAQHNFKGIFAVVSDPVDLLCKSAFEESNKDEDGTYSFHGLSPEQIRGYGLGVMNARACYYARQDDKYMHYITEGRAFGPHGEGLIIANSIDNYDEEISNYLTDRTKKANLEIRSIGFKPYIAPALSSGSLSLIATIKGQWHYSATFLGGRFMGCRNRLLPNGIELETYKDIPEALYNKLRETYNNFL